MFEYGICRTMAKLYTSFEDKLKDAKPTVSSNVVRRSTVCSANAAASRICGKHYCLQEPINCHLRAKCCSSTALAKPWAEQRSRVEAKIRDPNRLIVSNMFCKATVCSANAVVSHFAAERPRGSPFCSSTAFAGPWPSCSPVLRTS